MIKILLFYLVIVLKFKQNECIATKEQEIKLNESIEKETKEPILPLSYEKQEQDDKPVEANTQLKHKEKEKVKTVNMKIQQKIKEKEKVIPGEINIQQKQIEKETAKPGEIDIQHQHKEKEKPVETNRQHIGVETVKPKRKSEEVEPDEIRIYSTIINNFSAERDKTEEETTEIITIPKENVNKTTELKAESNEKEKVDLKNENKVNLLKDADNKMNVTKNETRRASNSKETKNILEDLSEVANPSATTRLPFPLLTMDHVLYNKTAQLIKMVQNEDPITRNQNPPIYYPVNQKSVLDSGSKNKPLALRRVNRARKLENPKVERMYIISNSDVLESYMNRRRSKIDTSLSQKSVNVFDKEDLGLDSVGVPRGEEDDTNLKDPFNKALNYEDKSDDYIISTSKHGIWDYEHESWAAATETVNWDNVESSGERERDSDKGERDSFDKFSSEKKQVIEEEHELLRSKEMEEDNTFVIKKFKNKEDGLTSLNIDTKKKDCDDKDIVVKIKTVPAARDTRLRNRIKGQSEKSVLNRNKHIETYINKKRNTNKHYTGKPKYYDSLEKIEKMSNQRHKKRIGSKNTQKKRNDVDNNNQFNIRHRVDMERDGSNKQPSKRAKLPSRLFREENSETPLLSSSQNLTKRMISNPVMRQRYDSKQKDIGFRSKITNDPINKTEHRLPYRTDRHEITERPLNHQRTIRHRSDKKTFDHDSESFLKRTIQDVAKSGLSKKKEKKLRAFEDYKDNYDNHSDKKKSQIQNIDWKDSKEAKLTESKKEEISGDAINDKNKQDTHKQWDRHANNEWDKVGINKDKQEVSRPNLKHISDKNDKDYNNPRESQKDNNMGNNEHGKKDIKWSEERYDHKKEVSKSTNNDRIDKDYNQFENKKAKIYPLDHVDTRQDQKDSWHDNSKEGKSSKNKFSGEEIKSRNKNIHSQDDYRDDYGTNKQKSHNYKDNTYDYRDNREEQTTKKRIVRDEFSREERHSNNNERNTNEPYDKHANNDWDKVGVDSGKKETTRRTSKLYNDYNGHDYEPQRSQKGHIDEVTTFHSNKAEKQTWDRHENNNWDVVGVDNKMKARSRGRLRENSEPIFVHTALPFRERKSVYDSE